MANVKISALPALTSGYVGGTDVFPIVNLSTTKKVTPYAFLQGYLTVGSTNGFTGTLSAIGVITLTTSITGLLKGSGGALALAVSGTDYGPATSGLATGILKNTTGTGAHTIAVAGTDYISPTGSETMTNKTITAPAISSPTITGTLVGSASGLGYGAGLGVGGTVTQITSKATTVVLNKICGVITTDAANLAANTTVQFQVTNSTVTGTDVVFVSRGALGTNMAYQIWIEAIASGAFYINVRNVTGGALAEAVTINFAVIKSVST